VVLSLLLIGPLNHVGIALATSISSWFNVILLFGILVRRGHYHPDQRLARRLAGMIIASTVMGGGLWIAKNQLSAEFSADLAARIIALAILIASGGALYVVGATATGAARLGEVKNMLKRRTDR
ncbi:MAG: polysaccharide biosynthesis C-terminal domain-containing protein, partial [Sneathiella sp.]|nr:polysaccharide biosynthesis C-terminal domain-containing protein [Sneathiella sp.]